MGRSRNDIDVLIANLRANLNDNIVYERYQQTVSEIESRNDIPKIRVAIYEQADSATEILSNYKPTETLTSYGIDISVYRAYNGDDASWAELTMLDTRDAIIDWAFNLSPASITDCNLFTWRYRGTANTTRLRKFVTTTMTFEARKNLLQNQN